MNVSEVLNHLVGTTISKQEDVSKKPVSAKDIKVKCCLECPFRECVQNSCVDRCNLIEYSSIGDLSTILDNCLLKVKSINISLKV